MNLVFTDTAEADLETIGDYIALSSPLRGASYVREKCADLRDKPRAFPLLPLHKSAGIRRRVYGNHLIFYRIREQTVEIIRILHGAMDYEQVLFLPDG